MSNRFTDKVAVVTGGSTGIGYAIAKLLIEEDIKRVYITGRTLKTLEIAASSLGEKAVCVVSDVSKLSDIEILKSEIQKRGDELDIIVANAGVAENNQFGETSEEQYTKIFDINVKGVFFTVQTLLDLLKDGSAIILIASIVSNKGMPNLSLYNASKAAVRSFARSMANDLKHRKIRVNALSPGITKTPILENGLKMSKEQISAFEAYAKDAVPLGYIAQPEEIASATLFLASNDASYVNGIEFDVDGGFAQV